MAYAELAEVMSENHEGKAVTRRGYGYTQKTVVIAVAFLRSGLLPSVSGRACLEL
jgi:hypothetical protein